MSKKMRIAVIGGGASGLFAAIAAKTDTTSVTIYEKEKRVGKKILATGNGRCNMSNILASESDYHGHDVSFMRSAIERYWVTETLDFFSDMGVLWKTEDEGKVYPYSDTASSVLDVLRRRVDAVGVNVECEFAVRTVKKKGNGFVLESVSGASAECDRVIVATGGRAGTQLGSDGSGYAILKGLGHRITPITPSLVQIKTETDTVRKLKGIKVNANVTLGGKSRSGELLFTDYGISGPPVFWLSAYLGSADEVSIDIMPEYSFADICSVTEKRCRTMGDVPLEDFFVGMLNKRVSQAILKYAGIMPLSRLAQTLTQKEIKAVAAAIKGLRLKIEGTVGWNNAQVTKGGADVSQFDSRTMQSRLVMGLYACGELLDIDGDCGGYNLQWAWSSGYIAGASAAERI